MSDTPEHYRTGGVTPWEYCAAKFPESYDDHLLITAIEYISRAKHKAGAADIRKAYNNLGHWLKRNERETEPEPEPTNDKEWYEVQYNPCHGHPDRWEFRGLYNTRREAEQRIACLASEFRIVEGTHKTLPKPTDDPVYRVQCQYPGSERWEHYGTFSDLARAKDTAKEEADHSPNRKWRVLDGKGQEILRVEPKGGGQ